MAKALKPHNGWIADYYRRSSADDKYKQVQSLENQIRLSEETWSLLPDEIKAGRVRKEYEAESESAFKLGNRMVYAAMIQDAREGKVFAVRALNFSRMSRTPKEAGEFVQLMLEGIIRFFISTEKHRVYRYDNPDDIAELMRQGGVNTKYSMDLGVSVKTGMDTKAKSGGHASGPVQFGFKPYRYFDDNGEEHREVVHDGLRHCKIMPLFMKAASGYSLKELALWSRQELITLRATPKRPERPLNPATIARILHDPFYKGFRQFDEIVTKWTEEPPVPPELWERVQITMSLRRTSGARKKSPELRRHFFFDRTVFCAHCGLRLNAYKKTIKSNGKTFVYYECKKKLKDAQVGCGTCIRQDRLLEQYQEVLARVTLPEETLIILRENLLALHAQKTKNRSTELNSLTLRYKKVDTALGEQVRALAKSSELGVGYITEAEISRLKEEREVIKKKIDVSHTETTDWIDQAIRSYELLHLAQEAMMYGSPQIRANIINAITTNLNVDGKKLICKLRSPFQEVAFSGGVMNWWSSSVSNLAVL